MIVVRAKVELQGRFGQVFCHIVNNRLRPLAAKVVFDAKRPLHVSPSALCIVAIGQTLGISSAPGSGSASGSASTAAAASVITTLNEWVRG